MRCFISSSPGAAGGDIDTLRPACLGELLGKCGLAGTGATEHEGYREFPFHQVAPDDFSSKTPIRFISAPNPRPSTSQKKSVVASAAAANSAASTAGSAL